MRRHEYIKSVAIRRDAMLACSHPIAYATATGKRYHRINTCSAFIPSSEVLPINAELIWQYGLAPCPRCRTSFVERPPATDLRGRTE